MQITLKNKSYGKTYQIILEKDKEINRLKQAIKDCEENWNEIMFELKEENEKLTKECEKSNRVSLAKYNRLKYEKERLELSLSVIKDYKARNDEAIKLLKEAGCYDEETKTFCDDIFEELPSILNALEGCDKE